MSACTRFAAIALLLCISGCRRNSYRVEMTPTADGVERRLTFQGLTESVGHPKALDPEIKKFAQIYAADPRQAETKKVAFRKTFHGALPDDVGGRGQFLRWNSPLGSAVIYVERFRGNDDLFGQMETRRKAVDELADLITEWLQSELKASAGWLKLKSFLETDFRKDLQNLSLLGWAGELAIETTANNVGIEIGIRAAQYAVERGYVLPADLPAIFSSAQRWNNGGSVAALERVRRFLRDRSRDGEQSISDEQLSFLANAQALVRSWQNYVRTNESYMRRREARLKQIADEEKANPSRKSPFPRREDEIDFDVSLELVRSAMFPIRLFQPFDEVNVRLAAPRMPIITNGKWNETNKAITWENHLTVVGETVTPDWPDFCYAVWDEPNDAAQVKLFGTVRVTGDRLLQYALWYEGLAEPERREWDTFLASLPPKAISRETLKSFRFSTEGKHPHDDSYAALMYSILEGGRPSKSK